MRTMNYSLAIASFVVLSSAGFLYSNQAVAQDSGQAASSQGAPAEAPPGSVPIPRSPTPPGMRYPEGTSHIGDLTGVTNGQDRGGDLYYRYCWGCHGARGDGNGENAPYVTPTPRNFVAAVFKCRSTPTGYLPTEQDIYNTLERGIITSNMPNWSALSAQNRADLVAFIKTFSPRWTTEKPGTPIVVPPEPKVTLESIKHGRELFTKLECWKCHGPQGRGDGPSASTLTDSNDQPIRPYNFYTGYRFKCGTTNQDLYKIFMTGLDGTPMPSFADVIKPEEAWDLVHFLRTLQIWHKSPELALWESTPEGRAYVQSEKVENVDTGSGIHP
jgi:mono/diheme cytochrome c family protein